MPLSDQKPSDGDKTLSDGESTPNSIGVWLVIGVVLSVLVAISNHRNHERSGTIISLLAFFGVMVLVIIGVAKVADSFSSQHAFDKPGGEQPRQPEATSADDTKPAANHH